MPGLKRRGLETERQTGVTATGVAQPTGKPAEHEGPRTYHTGEATAPVPDPTEGLGFAFVGQVSQAHLPITDAQGDQFEQLGVGLGGGQVVFPPGAHVGGPQRPAVGGGDDLDVSAVMLVLAAPPQVHAGGGAGSVDPVGLDEGAVHDYVGVAGSLGRQQGVVQ